MRCDCHLRWINGVKSLTGSCETPEILNGTYLFTLTSEQLSCKDPYSPWPWHPRCDTGSMSEVLSAWPARVTENQVTLAWDVSDGVELNVFVVGYVADGSSTFTPVKTLESDAREFTFTSLQQGTSYKTCVFIEEFNTTSFQQACVSVETAIPTSPPPTTSPPPQVSCPNDTSDLGPCVCSVTSTGRAIDVSCENVNVTVFGHLRSLEKHGAHIERVAIRKSDIAVVPVNAFGNLSISKLQMTFCEIINFEDGALNGLEDTLTQLELSNNKLSSVPVNAISGLSMLSSLQLQGNEIQQISGGDFESNVQLEELLLYDNVIANIDSNAFLSLSNLVTLDLDKNKLTNISPAWFSNMKNTLTTLEMQRNRIEAIPENAFNGLSKLQNLKLYDNLITNISENAFSEMYLVTDLQLHSNRIQGLPSDMFTHMGQLTSVNLQMNNIRSLPARLFSNQTKVSTVDLFCCQNIFLFAAI